MWYESVEIYSIISVHVVLGSYIIVIFVYELHQKTGETLLIFFENYKCGVQRLHVAFSVNYHVTVVS